MVARKFGYWETTQETAWSLIALTDWMVATGEAGHYPMLSEPAALARLIAEG